MFEAFTEPARRIVFFARYEAGRLKFEAIEAEHLLLGFILEDQGAAAWHLRKVLTGTDTPTEGELILPSAEQRSQPFLDRATAESLQSKFSGVGPRSEPHPTHGDMPVADGAHNILANAVEHANGSAITPLHLLSAMLCDPEGLIAQTLIEHGITRDRVDDGITRRKKR